LLVHRRQQQPRLPELPAQSRSERRDPRRALRLGARGRLPRRSKERQGNRARKVARPLAVAAHQGARQLPHPLPPLIRARAASNHGIVLLAMFENWLSTPAEFTAVTTK